MTPRVRVWLTGERGAGKSMVLDRDDWEMLSRDFGDRWTLTRPNHPTAKPHIITRRRKARQAAGELANLSNVYLGRIIARPKRGEHVHYLDGDSLNLTRSNLTTRKPTRWEREAPVRVHYFDGDARESTADAATS